MPQSGGNTHFGFQQVALGDKQARVDDVFHSVARRYDLMPTIWLALCCSPPTAGYCWRRR